MALWEPSLDPDYNDLPPGVSKDGDGLPAPRTQDHGVRLVAAGAIPPPVQLQHVRTLVVAGRLFPRDGERAVDVHRPD